MTTGAIAKRRAEPAAYVVAKSPFWALAPVLLLGTSACVLPYWELEKVEPDVNSIPVILPETIVPARTRNPVVTEIGEGCQHQTFSATVLDYDGASELHFKWLLTASIGDRSRTGDLAAGSVTASELPVDTIIPGLSSFAPSAASYKLGLDLTQEVLAGEFDDVDGLAKADKTHLLQVWVSDRRFGAGEDNTTTQTPAGEAPQPADSASWLVRIQATTDCAVIVEGGG